MQNKMRIKKAARNNEISLRDEITMGDDTAHPDLTEAESFTNYSHQYKAKQMEHLELTSIKTF